VEEYDRSRGEGDVVGAGKGILRYAAVLFLLALLGGCAAPRPAAKQEKPESSAPQNLPTLETIYADPQSQPPDYLPQMLPPDTMYGSIPSVGIKFYMSRPPGPYEENRTRPEDVP